MYFRVLTDDGKRNRWTVKVKATTLINRCKERIEHHESRANFWEEEHTAAEKELRESGITLKHVPISGGERVEAALDSSLARRVAECENKVKRHRDAILHFKAFRSFFSLAQHEESFELNADDVLYFNLEQADAGDEEEE